MQMDEGKELAKLAKDYLSVIEELDKLIDRKQTERDYLYNRCFKITATLKQDVVSTSNNNNGFEDIIAKVDAFDCEINKDIDRLIDIRLEAVRLLISLNNQDFYDVLHMKYFEYDIYDGFDDIADQMHCDYRTATRKHGEALVAFGKILKSCP